MNVGEHLGIDKLAHWANLLGFGVKSGIGLDNEKPGLMPSSAWKEKRYHERWYPAETLSVAIGQGYVAATPLQLAQLAAEVANGGTRYRPQFVKEVEGLDGGVANPTRRSLKQRIPISPDNLETVKDAMADVVNGPGGTGHKAALPGITVCGKSGTAQVVGDKGSLTAGEDESKMPEKYRDNAWFIAFAPKEHPQIADRLPGRARRPRRQRGRAGNRGGDEALLSTLSAARRTRPDARRRFRAQDRDRARVGRRSPTGGEH